jgi:stage IV sporulation protein FB
MELGRIAGIPIYLDPFFVLILLLFAYPYFTAGDTQRFSIGLIIVAGVLVSILLHELGHALAGRLFRVETSEIELTGLGGVARFATSLPRSVLARSVIYLAGPAVNLLLWWGGRQLAVEVVGLGKPALFEALAVLAIVNWWLMLFNLLPAYPLDGGHTLDAWLGAIVGPIWSTRVVAILGLLVCAGVVVWAIANFSIWMLFLAFVLFQVNWAAWDSVKR